MSSSSSPPGQPVTARNSIRYGPTATLAISGWPPTTSTGGALDVQASLWHGRRMRAVGLPDLLIAAVAGREHVAVLHYDGDYELIAQVTGQPTQWVVPHGTVP